MDGLSGVYQAGSDVGVMVGVEVGMNVAVAVSDGRGEAVEVEVGAGVAAGAQETRVSTRTERITAQSHKFFGEFLFLSAFVAFWSSRLFLMRSSASRAIPLPPAGGR